MGKRYSNTYNITQYEKVNPKIKKHVKNIKRNCANCGRNKSQISTK